MVVHEHDGMRRRHDGDAEDLPRLRHRFVERTHRHNVVPFDAHFGVEHQNGHTFAVRVELRAAGNVPVPVVQGVLRTVHHCHRLGNGALPEADHFPFLRPKRLSCWGRTFVLDKFKLFHSTRFYAVRLRQQVDRGVIYSRSLIGTAPCGCESRLPEAAGISTRWEAVLSWLNDQPR